MPDLAKFEVRQADLAYTANLDPPSFDLFARWVEFQDAVYSRFSRFQLRLADIKLESTSNNPADLSVACWILNYGALIRYRLDRVEARSNRARVSEDAALATDIVEQAMEVLRAVNPNARVAMHTVTVAIHGLLLGDSPTARVATYVTATPKGTPAFVPDGVSFLCEFPSGDGRGSIVLERSGSVTGGAFLRVVSEHAGLLAEREVLGRGIDFFQTSVKRLSLEVVWGADARNQ